MGKRFAGILFLAVLFAIPVLLIAAGGLRGFSLDEKTPGRPPLEKLEQTVAQNFPAADFFRRLQVSLSYMGGNKEQNGVFISQDSLMLDVQPKDEQAENANTLMMLDFAEDYQRASYVMLIPTACAVQQSKVPYPEVAQLYDQKALIDDVYRRVSGHVNAIGVYPILFSHQDEYIYYRTDNTLTGLGGYYLYTVAARTLGLKVREIDQFDVKHIDYNYYGDLYRLSPYREVKADRVSEYVFSKFQRNYTVTHYDQNGVRRYFTLYPEFRRELGGTMDVLLGGMSPVMDITINSKNVQYNQLLIFTDRSVQSYLPFLLIHYGRVTVVDTSQVTPAMLSTIDVSQYTQVLFSYMVDTFIGSDELTKLYKLPALTKEDG
ncbi:MULTISPECIES: DHHW family protein [Anaerotruncus]|jgi:hypothetical protein|uniref:DHHW family protein n=1 Tax=Anaerotruncus TaxID=244127 RepID=UPI0008372543|nr:MULTISPECIES: DHHW family protein [Anaerotruncus]RGX54436.1 hypothetical protein DWV16_13680 [Anaerotruncus sp. AF02-27]